MAIEAVILDIGGTLEITDTCWQERSACFLPD